MAVCMYTSSVQDFFPTPEMAFSSNDLVDLIYAKPIAYTDIV